METKATNYVVMLHGILKTEKHMAKLAAFLQENGYEVFNFGYPSTHYPLEQLRDSIIQAIVTEVPQDQNTTVHFVGYSMGGLLVRMILNSYRPPKLGRVVQLATPNHGSEVADFWKNFWLYQQLFGPAGQQLTTDQSDIWDLLIGEIDYELGIIAGSHTLDHLSSWFLLKKQNDGKVTVESTALDGMQDHIVIPATHLFFPKNTKVMQQTLSFLQQGYFQRS